MGLFDFVSDLGQSLFGLDAEAAEAEQKIKDFILADNPGIDDLDVNFKDGVVSLEGKAASVEALEKAVLMAGNVEGVTSVNADDVDVAGGADVSSAIANVTYYTIEKGDSLWKIAESHYSDGNKYTAIFEANKEVIKDPDLIYPGQKIRLP